MKQEALYKALRKYVRADVITASMTLMQKLGRAQGDLSQRETAEAIYLACGVQDKERARAAVSMERDDTTAGRAVRELERLLLLPDSRNESGVPTNVVRDLSRHYRGKAAAVRPGYIDGQQIQVRGGATAGWSSVASSYVVEG